MSSILYAATLATALGCGLVAGVFFAFSTFVMAALRRLKPEEGIAASPNMPRQDYDVVWKGLRVNRTTVQARTVLPHDAPRPSPGHPLSMKHNQRRKPMDVARMPEPGATEGSSRQDLLRIYEQTKTIAIVGASANGHKAAHLIPTYLQSQRYRIIPVNPKGGEILGECVYPSLEQIDAPVDVVDIFRPPAEAEAITRQAIVIGADVLCFQPGTHTTEAIQLAADAELTVVAGRCMGATHGELGLGPGLSRTIRPSESAIAQ